MSPSVWIWNDQNKWTQLQPGQSTGQFTEDWDFIYVPQTGKYYKVGAKWVDVTWDAANTKIEAWYTGPDETKFILDPLDPNDPDKPAGPP